jgi:sirohydrochlorin ferrochelatase
LTSSSPLILVFHGSRSARSQLAASWLAQLITRELTSDSIVTQENYLEQQSNFLRSAQAGPFEGPDGSLLSEAYAKMSTFEEVCTPIVRTAALELTTIPLHQKLVDLARFSLDRGCSTIRILPLFLTPGVHVKEDIPAQVALAQKISDRSVKFEILPYLGSYRGLVDLLRKQFAEFPNRERILMAHGSRYPEADRFYRDLAENLQATLAYWSIEPSLSDRVRLLVEAGKSEIVILPYFLFPGRISQAIVDRVGELSQNFPQAKLVLTPPLGATPELARLIAKEIKYLNSINYTF